MRNHSTGTVTDDPPQGPRPHRRLEALSGARRLVRDGGGASLEQNKRLDGHGLRHRRQCDKLSEFSDRHTGATGRADAALVCGVRQCLATGLCALLGLDSTGMTVLAVVVPLNRTADVCNFLLKRNRDLRGRMMRAGSAKQHGCCRQPLERDGGHDQPEEKQAKLRHQMLFY